MYFRVLASARHIVDAVQHRFVGPVSVGSVLARVVKPVEVGAVQISWDDVDWRSQGRFQ